MNSDNPTDQISFNLVAICVFGMTISSLVAPLLNISSTVPTLGIFAIVVGATVDNFWFGSTAATLIVDAIASTDPAYRQRIIHHEAGHFLVAYLLNIPIASYTLSAWESISQGISSQGGVIFAPPQTDIATQVQQYCTVCMAGIAAEKLVYVGAASQHENRSQGGSEDRQKLRKILSLTSKPPQALIQQENLAALQAKTLIQSHWEAYQALVVSMTARASVADCCNMLLQSGCVTAASTSSLSTSQLEITHYQSSSK